MCAAACAPAEVQAVSALLGNGTRTRKCLDITEALAGDASVAEVRLLLSAPVTAAGLLFFVRCCRWRAWLRRLPLPIHLHIEHCLRNACLRSGWRRRTAFPVEEHRRVPRVLRTTRVLPGDVRYVLCRIASEEDDVLLSCGWTLLSLASAEALRRDVLEASHEGADAAWSDHSRTQFVATRYEGMGHFSAMAVVDDDLYVHILGGANGWDRLANAASTCRRAVGTRSSVAALFVATA